jgi:hypothetical protein
MCFPLVGFCLEILLPFLDSMDQQGLILVALVVWVDFYFVISSLTLGMLK